MPDCGDTCLHAIDFRRSADRKQDPEESIDDLSIVLSGCPRPYGRFNGVIACGFTACHRWSVQSISRSPLWMLAKCTTVF